MRTRRPRSCLKKQIINRLDLDHGIIITSIYKTHEKLLSSLQSPVSSLQSLVALICLIFVSLTISSAAKTLFNQYVNVEIDTPAGITQFTGATLVNDFYFVGKATSPTTKFDIKYKVTLTKEALAAGCVLVAPVPAAGTKEKMTGGLVISYTVERKVKGEKKIEGNIYFLPVEIKVNDTAKEEDDFVAVSKGTDDDLATDFSVKITGTDGVTAELKVKPVKPIDGDIKFKEKELALASGKEVKTKLWGITPSSDRDKTIIEVILRKDYKELGKIEENVTVFKGVKLKFSGTFGSDIDSIIESWRPHALYEDAADVIAEDIKTHGSKISFHNGDQGNLKLRAHSPKRDVKISAATTLLPAGIDIYKEDDTIKDAELWFKEGRFEPSRWVGGVDDVGGRERILNAIVQIKSNAAEELCELESTSNDPRIAVSPGANAPLGIVAQVKAAKDTSKIAKWLLEYQGGNPGNIKKREKSVDTIDHEDSIAYWAEDIASRNQAFYDNDSYKGIKKAQIKKSITVKGLIGADQAGMKIKFSFVFEFWNCWTLTGKINEFSELLNQ